MKKRMTIAERMSKGLKEKEDKQKEKEEMQLGYFKPGLNLTKFQLEKIDPPKDGSQLKLSFDFLPYIVTSSNHPDKNFFYLTPGDEWFRRPFATHSINVPPYTIVCPQFTEREPCPICEYRTQKYKEKAPKKEIPRMSFRDLYIIVPKEIEDYEEKPHILDVSRFTFGKLLEAEAKEQGMVGFSMLDGGNIVQCRFSRESIKPEDPKSKQKTIEFYKVARVDFNTRDYKYPDDYSEQLPRLDDVLEVLPYKKIEALFYELDDEKSEPEEVVQVEDSERVKKTTIPTIPVTPVETTSEKEEVVPEKTVEPKKSNTDPTCPHGHTIGIDFEQHPECELDCELWEVCFELSPEK